MSRCVLHAVVTLGGHALQKEDTAIRNAVSHRGEHGGLARMENERYHQFVIWRAVLPIWPAEVEANGQIDLTVIEQLDMHFFEMKNWRADVHLAAIQHDVAALRDRLGEHRHGYILVTAMNPLGMTDENLQYLLAHVPDLINVPRELFRFPTKDVDNEDYEFWVCGWPVLPAGQAPAPEQAG